MKRILFTLLIGIAFLDQAQAQRVIELTGFYGNMVNTDLKTYYGTYKLEDNPNYGGILSVEVAPGTFGEFLYNRSDTRFRYVYGSLTSVPAYSSGPGAEPVHGSIKGDALLEHSWSI